MAEPLPRIYRRSTPQRQNITGAGLDYGMQAQQINSQSKREMGSAAQNLATTGAGILAQKADDDLAIEHGQTLHGLTGRQVLQKHYNENEDADHNTSLQTGQTKANGILSQARQQAAGVKDPKQRKEIYAKAQAAVDKLVEDPDNTLFRQSRTKKRAGEWWTVEKERWNTETALSVTEADAQNIEQAPYNNMEQAVLSAKDPDSYATAYQTLTSNTQLIKGLTPESKKKVLKQYQVKTDTYYAELKQTEIQQALSDGVTGIPFKQLVEDGKDDLKDLKSMSQLDKDRRTLELDQLLELDKGRQAHDKATKARQIAANKKAIQSDYYVRMKATEAQDPAKHWNTMTPVEIYKAPIADANKLQLLKARTAYFKTADSNLPPVQQAASDIKLFNEIRPELVDATDAKKSQLYVKVQGIKDVKLKNFLMDRIIPDPVTIENDTSEITKQFRAIIEKKLDLENKDDWTGDPHDSKLRKVQRARLFADLVEDFNTYAKNEPDKSKVRDRYKTMIKSVKKEENWQKVYNNYTTESAAPSAATYLTTPAPTAPAAYKKQPPAIGKDEEIVQDATGKDVIFNNKTGKIREIK